MKQEYHDEMDKSIFRINIFLVLSVVKKLIFQEKIWEVTKFDK